MAKKIILILLAVLLIPLVTGIIYFEHDPENTNINYSPADPEKATDTTIRFDSNGKLKILHIADPHLANDKCVHSDVGSVCGTRTAYHQRKSAFRDAV